MGAPSIFLLLSLLGFPDAGDPLRPAPAQDRYEKVPIQGNLDFFLKQLLSGAEEKESIDELVKQLAKNPHFLELDSKKRDEILRKLTDPKLGPLLLKMAQQPIPVDQLSPEKLQSLLETLTKNPDPLLPDIEPAALPQADDPIANWTKDFLQQLDDSRAGEFLRGSAAWRDALRSLEGWTPARDAKVGWLERFTKAWRLPDKVQPRLGNLSGKMPNVPSMPRLSLNAPSLPRWSLNLGGGPHLSAPSVGAFGGFGGGDTIFWALVPILLALLGWFFYQKLGYATQKRTAAATLGPWPVDPAQVSTRTQLIQAFEYLALLLLGMQARTWNHRVIAAKMGTGAEKTAPAAELAQLYELARYTPGEEALPPKTQTTARRHLVQLAGGHAA